MSFVPAVVFLLYVATVGKCEPTLLALKPPLIPGEYLQNNLVAEYPSAKPYEFGYEFADGFGMTQHRREVADGSGGVKGSYGFVESDGRLRKVQYNADANGFVANIESNEPGLAIAGQSSANAQYFVQVPPANVIAQGWRPYIPKL